MVAHTLYARYVRAPITRVCKSNGNNWSRRQNKRHSDRWNPINSIIWYSLIKRTILYTIKHCLINRHEHHNCFDFDWSRVLYSVHVTNCHQTREREREKAPLRTLFYVGIVLLRDWLRSPSKHTHTHTHPWKHSRKRDLYVCQCSIYSMQLIRVSAVLWLQLLFHFVWFSSFQWFMIHTLNSLV